MSRLIKFIILDILKNRIVIFYTFLLAILSWGVFSLEDNSNKGLLSLLNVILLTVPLVSIIFSTIYLYNSSEFIELLLSQPIKRAKIWWSLFLGLTFSLGLSFLFSVALPVCIYAPMDIAVMMISVGLCISTVFVSLACMSTILTRDKAKGIGIAILLWLFFTLLFDGIILFLLFQFADYPIEKIMVAIAALNPIDLSRIVILLHLDISAMMGYTGAIFKDFFGTGVGIVLSFFILLLWIFIPIGISLHLFKKKDL